MNTQSMVGVYRSVGVPAAASMTLLVAAAWQLAALPWLGTVAIVFGAATCAMVMVNDICFDPEPRFLPGRARMVLSWLRANAGLAVYPALAALAILEWRAAGWVWLPYAAVFACAGFGLEVVVLLYTRRMFEPRGIRQCRRALLSGLVGAWVDVSVFFLLVGHWLFLAGYSSTPVLRVLVPLFALAVVADARVVWVHRAFWPWRH